MCRKMLELYRNWHTEWSKNDCSHNFMSNIWAKYVKHMFPSSHNSESCHITIGIIYTLSHWTKLQIHVTQLKPPTVICLLILRNAIGSEIRRSVLRPLRIWPFWFLCVLYTKWPLMDLCACLVGRVSVIRAN